MSRCVSFITIVDHVFGSWLGYHHEYDYGCNFTGPNIHVQSGGTDSYSFKAILRANFGRRDTDLSPIPKSTAL